MHEILVSTLNFKPAFILYLCQFIRETVVQVMHSVLLELWKEPSLSLMENKLLSVNRILLTVLVSIQPIYMHAMS